MLTRIPLMTHCWLSFLAGNGFSDFQTGGVAVGQAFYEAINYLYFRGAAIVKGYFPAPVDKYPSCLICCEGV